MEGIPCTIEILIYSQLYLRPGIEMVFRSTHPTQSCHWLCQPRSGRRYPSQSCSPTTRKVSNQIDTLNRVFITEKDLFKLYLSFCLSVYLCIYLHICRICLLSNFFCRFLLSSYISAELLLFYLFFPFPSIEYIL